MLPESLFECCILALAPVAARLEIAEHELARHEALAAKRALVLESRAWSAGSTSSSL